MYNSGSPWLLPTLCGHIQQKYCFVVGFRPVILKRLQLAHTEAGKIWICSRINTKKCGFFFTFVNVIEAIRDVMWEARSKSPKMCRKQLFRKRVKNNNYLSIRETGKLLQSGQLAQWPCDWIYFKVGCLLWPGLPACPSLKWVSGNVLESRSTCWDIGHNTCWMLADLYKYMTCNMYPMLSRRGSGCITFCFKQ